MVYMSEWDDQRPVETTRGSWYREEARPPPEGRPVLVLKDLPWWLEHPEDTARVLALAVDYQSASHATAESSTGVGKAARRWHRTFRTGSKTAVPSRFVIRRITRRILKR